MAQKEPYRPQFHFTPPQGWMNDPNGLVFYQGEYHLFYQHNPEAGDWGPMHWGHAVSTDLVNWQHLPIALFPDQHGTIFSGSAVVDWDNSSGFGKEALVAIFTHNHDAGQCQSLAYSTDRGRTWIKYSGNPVLRSPDGRPDFRDPKVFWYGNRPGPGHWAMVVAAGHEVLLYNSSDLIHWQPTGSFGADDYLQGVWETPDLFQLRTADNFNTRWVLTSGALGEHSIAGGTGMRYFIGDFDGRTFTCDHPPDTKLWVDFGADFYAAQSWGDLPDGRRIWIGWLNNWKYARETPTEGWRGALSVPRELSLVQTSQGIRLSQRPVPELRSLRGGSFTRAPQVIRNGSPLMVREVGPSFELLAEFTPEPGSPSGRLGIHIHFGEMHRATIVYDHATRTFLVDRLNSGRTDFQAGFGTIHVAPYPNSQVETLDFHIFVDHTSIEVFAQKGQVVFSELIFPTSQEVKIQVFSEDSTVQLRRFELTPLESHPQ